MRKPGGITEEEIIRGCVKGGLKWQEMLYRHFYGYAMGISLRYSLNRDDALEVVNDGFIKIFNTINRYDSNKPFKAWLRTIMVNTAIDRRRRDLKFQLNTELDDTVIIPHQATAIERLNVDDIIGMMQHLPPIQLTVFNLYEIDGYSHDEIGKMLSIPASSSRVYLTRAKEKLRNIIRAEAQEHGRSAG